jgi:hypothetical protein
MKIEKRIFRFLSLAITFYAFAVFKESFNLYLEQLKIILLRDRLID